jgi:hypothetical protein
MRKAWGVGALLGIFAMLWAWMAMANPHPVGSVLHPDDATIVYVDETLFREACELRAAKSARLAMGGVDAKIFVWRGTKLHVMAIVPGGYKVVVERAYGPQLEGSVPMTVRDKTMEGKVGWVVMDGLRLTSP